MVTTAPLSTVMGPVLMAFFPEGIAYEVVTIWSF
jgi:hypothetical protein